MSEQTKIFRGVFFVVVFVSLAVLLLSCMSGCDAIRDGVATAIGAPTTTQIAATKTALENAEGQTRDLQAQLTAAENQQAAAEQARTDTTAKAKIAQQTLARVATDLAAAPPASPEAQALMSVSANLQQQIATLAAQAGEYGDLAARYGQQAAQISAALEANQAKITAAQTKLAAFDAATRSAIEGTGAAISQLGQTASDLGVPGAGPITTAVGAGITGLLGILFGVRKNSQAKAAQEQAAETHEAATSIVRSIEQARIKDPAFNTSFNAVKTLLKQTQTDAAQKLVAGAK